MHKWRWLLIFGGIILIACTPTTDIGTDSPLSTVTPENTPTYTPTVNAELPGYTSTTLEIIRNGKRYSILLGHDAGDALFRVIPRPDVNMFQWYGDIPNVQSANIEWYGDFDNDGETEYLVSVYGRGAIGYVTILAVDYDESKDEYRIFDEIGFRASCFERWDDIEKDGIPEIVGKDEDFHYASGGGGADSVFSPIKIFRYNGQKFIDVTKQYPDLIEQDANYWLEAIDNDAWGQGQFASVYASYLADMYLLDKRDEGIEVVSKLCINRLVPYIETQNPESTWSCDDFLIRIQDALSESGYD